MNNNYRIKKLTREFLLKYNNQQPSKLLDHMGYVVNAEKLFLRLGDLNEYLSSIIKDISFQSLKTEAELSYSKKIKRIREQFLKSQEVNEIKKYEFEISRNRRKYLFFIKLYADAKENEILYTDKFNNYLVERTIESYKNPMYFPDVIKSIAYYEQDLKDFWKWNTLFENLIQNEKGLNKSNKTFESLFSSKDLYNKAIKILEEKKFIKQTNQKLKWIHTPTKKYTTTQTLIALCVVLQKEQYFNLNQKAIYRNIENQFGITISKSTYSRSSNGFKRDYDTPNTTNFKYTSLFKGILKDT